MSQQGKHNNSNGRNLLMHSNQNNAKQLTRHPPQDMLMRVSSITSEIDPQTGFSVDHVDLEDSDFDRVDIKRINEDEMEIIVVEDDVEVTEGNHTDSVSQRETENFEWRYRVEIEERAVQLLKYHKPRRELDDDIQDALISAGYCVVGGDK